MIMALSIPALAEMKIGVVNMQAALEKSEAGKAALAKMKVEFDAAQTKVNAMQNELKQLQQSIENQSSLLTPEAKQEKIDDFQRKRKDLERFAKDSGEEMKKRERQYVNEIANELQKTLVAMGKEQAFDIILETQESGVLYFNDKRDLTNALVERYNKEWKK